jgi:hypothetical protein
MRRRNLKVGLKNFKRQLLPPKSPERPTGYIGHRYGESGVVLEL